MNPIYAAAAISRFQEFLRIRTISGEGPNGSYNEAVLFLKNFAAPLGHCEELEYIENKPVLLVTIPGRRPDLDALMLQSHYDVVPCDEQYWEFDPFEAVMTESGDIYARGTQDMKSVSMQYLEALHNLRSRDVQLDRTVYLVFSPDEEVGGVDGIGYSVVCTVMRGLLRRRFSMTLTHRLRWFLMRELLPLGTTQKFFTESEVSGGFD